MQDQELQAKQKQIITMFVVVLLAVMVGNFASSKLF
jgi:hypothetical protein